MVNLTSILCIHVHIIRLCSMAIVVEAVDVKEQYEAKEMEVAAKHHRLRQQMEIISAENSAMTKLCKGLKNGK